VTGATYDTGTVTLTVGGATAAKANYGQGDTPSSVAENLAASSSSYSSSGVAVAAVDDSISVVATGRGTASDLSYTLTAVTNNPTSFSHPSFAYPTLSGALDGGAGTDTTTTPIYTFCTAGSASPNCSLSGTGYDPAGNLLKYSDNVMGVWNFQYDTLNRLAGATDTAPASGAITGVSADYCWTYDAFGNRTTQAGSTTVFTNAIGSACATTGTLVNNWATYNTNNQITGTPQAAGGPTYDPSGAGYILNDGVNQYLYDAEGRICAVAATPVAGITTYTGYLYDADGTRIAKGTITSWSCDPTKNGFTTTNDYVLGLGGEQLTEMGVNTNTGGTSNTLAWQHANVWAGGKLLGTYDKDGLHFYFDDPLGTRRAQTDSVGVPEQTCTSLPYGDDLNCSGGNLQAPTEHHFTGKERDVESGNDYFGARYYSSAMSRFLSPDWSAKEEPVPYAKLGDPQSLNLYAYVRNHPTDIIDADGHQDAPCIGCDSMAGTPFEGITHHPISAGMGLLKSAYNSLIAGDIMDPLDDEEVLLSIPKLQSKNAGEAQGMRVAPLVLFLTTGPLGGAEEGGVTIELRMMEGWNAEERAAALEKVAALNGKDLVVADVERAAGSAASRYRKAGRVVNSATHDVDHIHDLQLGGRDVVENMGPLHKSVNRSLGAQIHHKIRNLPVGTKIKGVTIR